MISMDKIVGEDRIKAHFKSAIEKGSVNHAYIFDGEAGSGKKMLARAFAKTLECQEHGTEPCNHCKSCIQTDSGNQPDIITVTHEKPMVISVNEIRQQVVDEASIRPYSSRYKIFIIPDAELLNVQAQNALLKTIEEPPEYVIIMLLTTNIGSMLPTIMSRCVRLTVQAVDNRQVYQYLKDNYPDLGTEELSFATEFAMGNIGKAIRCTTSPEFQEIRDRCFDMLEHINRWEVEDIVFYLDNTVKDQAVLFDWLDLIKMWMRDVLLFKATRDPNQLILKDKYNVMKRQAEVASYEKLEEIIRGVGDAKVRVKARASVDMVLELLLFRIKGAFKDM